MLVKRYYEDIPEGSGKIDSGNNSFRKSIAN